MSATAFNFPFLIMAVHIYFFFALMLNRFGGQGLYILDEPEAALSPTRQMAMLSRMSQLVEGSV